MTIKRKIWFSNVLMILIPILSTSIIVIVCLNTFLGSYWHTLISMYSDENGVQFAQSMLYNYQKELWEFDWIMCQKADGSREICPTAEMTDMGNALSELGYRFMITKDGIQIYSNLSEEDLAVGKKIAGESMENAKTLTATRYDVSVIKNTFWHGEKVFCITAIHPEKTDGSAVNYLKKYFFRYAVGILVFFVVLSMLINGVLYCWISRSVLRPLKLLRQGTRKIRDGNLDVPMQYDKKDEFGEVCRDFEDMRFYLQESVRQRLEDEKRRKDLIRGISHDLRTPLTSICGYLDGLLDGIADTKEKQQRYLKAIKTRTGNMVTLVESLSEYCRLDRDFRYHMEKVDLKEYIGQYLEQNHLYLEQNQIEVESHIQEQCLVKLDTKEFKRIFDNLFTNTVKYREKETSRILISVKKALDVEKTELVIQDNGPGVPEEALEKLFDSFYRVDGARNRSETGSGIGLAVVKEIVLGHGGEIYAENRGGLAVIIRLPVVPKSQE